MDSLFGSVGMLAFQRILGYAGCLQGVTALIYNGTSRMWPVHNLQLMLYIKHVDDKWHPASLQILKFQNMKELHVIYTSNIYLQSKQKKFNKFIAICLSSLIGLQNDQKSKYIRRMLEVKCGGFNNSILIPCGPELA
ncbi:hypothetical protein Nmel_005748 [Mimus melanotis]